MGPRDRTPDRLLHIVSYERSPAASPLRNIASGHNFLYAPMTLQKVAAVSIVHQSCWYPSDILNDCRTSISKLIAYQSRSFKFYCIFLCNDLKCCHTSKNLSEVMNHLILNNSICIFSNRCDTTTYKFVTLPASLSHCTTSLSEPGAQCLCSVDVSSGCRTRKDVSLLSSTQLRSPYLGVQIISMCRQTIYD